MTAAIIIDLVDAEATDAAGFALGGQISPGDVVALVGTLGADKTSFARGMLRGLGLAHEAPSPTFGIVIPYDRPDVRLPVWHVDLYRIEQASDVVELGLDEVLTDGALIVEWPQLLDDRLLAGALALHLEITQGDARRLTAHVPPSWEGRCRFQ